MISCTLITYLYKSPQIKITLVYLLHVNLCFFVLFSLILLELWFPFCFLHAASLSPPRWLLQRGFRATNPLLPSTADVCVSAFMICIT